MPDLFADLPDASAGEVIQLLLAIPGLRIERIVSHGQASPPGFWYDQQEAEFVVLLSGAARIAFADGRPTATLHPGSYLHLPPHCRHRVALTSPDAPSIWLAIFAPG